MTDDREDPLIEAALTATEGGDVDWQQLSSELPRERETIAALGELASVAAAYRDPPDDTPGDAVRFRWGPLDVRGRIGTGSFGEVYAAWDPRLQRDVALKLRRAGSTDSARRWLEEARRLARIRHPNVVTVHGGDLHDGRAGMWMEIVRGATLEKWLREQGPMGAREAALIGAELCGALAAVHAAGLVHGDVKTHNIMREGAPGRAQGAGRIVLMDFGSARESASDDSLAPGTPLFTAPEVLAGGRNSVASDLWALGVVLYRLVTGKWPVEARSVDELRETLSRRGLTPLRTLRPDLPAGFVAAVERALDRDPTRRWRDAAEFERELLASLGTDRASATEWTLRHTQRRRRTRLAWLAGALAAIAAVTWLAITQGPKLWMAWNTRTPSFVATLVDEMAGSTPSAYFGSVMSNVGDVNGDGSEDVLIGAPGAGRAGEVYLATPRANRMETILTLRGEHGADLYGAMVMAIDLDGDDQRDFVISAPVDDSLDRDVGRVYVYSGNPQLDGTPDWIIDGHQTGQYFGWGIAAGDVNGDGHDDLLIGAPYDKRAGLKSGRVWVYFGGPDFDRVADLEVAAGREGSEFGGTLSFVGDFNGDGGGDFVVGAWVHSAAGLNRGTAFVYYGGRALDDRPDLILNGTQNDGFFGVTRQGVGDLNGDGYADIVVGSEGGNGLEPRTGSVSVFFGGPDADGVPDVRLGGEQRGSGFGVFMNHSHDVDGDGQVDLVVGAPWYDAREVSVSGRLYLYQGGPKFDAIPELVMTGPPNSMFGWIGCVIADHDGGANDLLVNLRNLSRPFPFAGIVQRYDVERWVVRPPQPNDGWAPGATATLRWSGATRANVAISIDEGRSWRTVARNAGGKAVNTASVAVPNEASRSVRVRLTTADRERNPVAREIVLRDQASAR